MASLQFAYRTQKTIGVFDAAPAYKPLAGFTQPEGNLRCSAYSPCGRFFSWASPESITVVDASTGFLVVSIPIANVYDLDFSPLGTYLITWERPAKDDAGDATKNLKIWRTLEDAVEGSQKKAVGSFVQKQQGGWNLQYSADEQYCARLVTNEVQFFKSHDLVTVWNKLRVEGATSFALAPGSQNHAVAVFVPERKASRSPFCFFPSSPRSHCETFANVDYADLKSLQGQPAVVQVYAVPVFQSPISQKTFFKGDKVQLKWNKCGSSILVLAQTDVDRSGKSYYGETTLYLLSTNGAFDARVTLDKEGPIHDVSWSPTSREFGVVYGYMPAKATIFNDRAVAKYTFPLCPRNTIAFSPSGRFVLVAGFGNLAGQIDVYDMNKDYRKICTIESGNPSVCEWSPDDRFIMTATTSPRLRVDNGVKLWHVGGSLMYNQEMVELYSVLWRPAPSENVAGGDPLMPAPQPHASATEYLGTVKTPSKPAGAYRPPGARGLATPLHFKREDEGGTAHQVSNGSQNVGPNGFGRPRRAVPGAEPAEPSTVSARSVPGAEAAAGDDGTLKKMKKKRGRKGHQEVRQEADPDGGVSLSWPAYEANSGTAREGRATPLDGNGRDYRNRPRNGAGGGRGATALGSQADASAQGGPPLGAQEAAAGTTNSAVNEAAQNPNAKKIRSLQKKMRAIEDLEMRLAGGEKLEDTQLKKINTKSAVLKELETLEKD